MAIRHQIRTGTGGVREVEVTPKRAIRLMCIECMGFSKTEPAHCTNSYCPLYPYRDGKPTYTRVPRSPEETNPGA